ncbi:helix-turn-helix domain-containing protein [Clostridium sp.]
MPILNTKIKEYREKALMKQADLAKLVEVRRETIVHYITLGRFLLWIQK